jgi:hypothetical protein
MPIKSRLAKKDDIRERVIELQKGMAVGVIHAEISRLPSLPRIRMTVEPVVVKCCGRQSRYRTPKGHGRRPDPGSRLGWIKQTKYET